LGSEKCHNCQFMNKTNNKNTTTTETAKAKTILKLGLDVHAATIMVGRQVEGLNPQPPQRFKVADFLKWAKGQVEQGFEVISCYEAGPTGYWLHWKLGALGVTNYVVCPTRLDSRGKGVNTDKTDALELVVRLDRYVAGNRKAFAVVKVPTPEQEQKRALSRQREQLRRQRLSVAAQGRMLLLSQGHRQSNGWWRGTRWSRLAERLPGWLVSQLECFVRVIAVVDQEVRALTEQISQAAPASLPRGLGRLTHEIIEREMKDWNHFRNRRQVGSYAGLTGGVSGSGESSADLSITKAGNRRLSACLIECAWRLVASQPNYWLVRKWQGVLCNPKAAKRRRKQVIVAFARQLLVDLWKWKTGKVTPERLGWIMV
jgi:transposase